MATWSDSVPSSPTAGDKFTYGGITYTYRVDNTMGVWDAAVAGSSGGKYSSGWQNSLGGVTVANGSTHTITHNLSTTEVIVQIYVNSSASDTNAQAITSGAELGSSGTTLYGACITSLSSDTITLQLGSGGYIDMSGTGTQTGSAATTLASKYIKVVVIT